MSTTMSADWIRALFRIRIGATESVPFGPYLEYQRPELSFCALGERFTQRRLTDPLESITVLDIVLVAFG